MNKCYGKNKALWIRHLRLLQTEFKRNILPVTCSDAEQFLFFCSKCTETSYPNDRFPTRFPQDTVSQPSYCLNPFTMNVEYQRSLLFTGASGSPGFNFAPHVFSQCGEQFGYGFASSQLQRFEQSCVPPLLNIYAHDQNNLPPIATYNYQWQIQRRSKYIIAAQFYIQNNFITMS